MITIESEGLEADFTSWRAELVAIRDKRGRNYLWDGNPDVWKGHAPILFPLVGMVPDDTAVIGGKQYTLKQHGFAPASEFELVRTERGACTFRLESSDTTRKNYPFNFCLDVEYSVKGMTLAMKASVTNRSRTVLPFSFGFHPGFCWPLPDTGSRAGHYVEFEKPEPAPIRRPLNGLLDPRLFDTPVEGRTLVLRDDLFDDGAIMFDELASRSLRFGSDGGPCLEIEWENLPHLGIWTKPGAGYLCVEPWQGFSALPDFTGELIDKPGILTLAPNHTQEFSMAVTITDRPAA